MQKRKSKDVSGVMWSMASRPTRRVQSDREREANPGPSRTTERAVSTKLLAGKSVSALVARREGEGEEAGLSAAAGAPFFLSERGDDSGEGEAGGVLENSASEAASAALRTDRTRKEARGAPVTGALKFPPLAWF